MSTPIYRRYTQFCISIAMMLTVSLLYADNSDPHAHHKAMMSSKQKLTVSRQQYQVPDVVLTSSEGSAVAVKSLLEGERPIALNFIYTTCTTICPVLTASMLQFQRKLNTTGLASPQMVSISIDPNFDQAAVLKEYAASYGADWTFLTGKEEAITEVLRAFDAYRGNKVNHFPLTLFRANSQNWTRVEGLSSAADLVGAWQTVVALK